MKILSQNAPPYADLVSGLFQKNVQALLRHQQVEKKPLNKQALALGFLQRKVARPVRSADFLTAKSEVMGLIGRRDLQELVNYDIYRRIQEADMLEEDRVQATLFCFLAALSRGRDAPVASFPYLVPKEPAFQSTRVARWLINAAVQNGLTIPDTLLEWLCRFRRSQVIVDLLLFQRDRVLEVGNSVFDEQQAILE